MVTTQLQHVWILEDDVDLRLMAVGIAGKLGYVVQPLRDLQEAWQLATTAKDTGLWPSHVISDFRLPDGTSEEWLAHLRISSPMTTVLCVSWQMTHELKTRLSDLGITAKEKNWDLVAIYRNFLAVGAA